MPDRDRPAAGPDAADAAAADAADRAGSTDGRDSRRARRDPRPGRRAGAASDPYARLRTFGARRRRLRPATRAAFEDRELGLLLTRALVDEMTTDNPGLMPPGLDRRRSPASSRSRQPAVVASGGRASLPDAGMDINWPYWTGDIETLVGRQPAEKTSLPSTKISLKRGSGADRVVWLRARRQLPAHPAQLAVVHRRGESDPARRLRRARGSRDGRRDRRGRTSRRLRHARPAGGDRRSGPRGAVRRIHAVEVATGAPATFGLAASDVFARFGGLTGLVPRPYGTHNVPGTADAASLRVNVSGLPILHDKPTAERRAGRVERSGRQLAWGRAAVRHGRRRRTARPQRSDLGHGRRRARAAESDRLAGCHGAADGRSRDQRPQALSRAAIRHAGTARRDDARAGA